MTYSEAIKLFDNNVAKMAEALEVTTQLIYHYKKTPDKPLPKLRQLQINMVLQNKGE
jgi:prefoldin subunit 5